MYDSEMAARAQARRIARLGTLLARLNIEDGGPVTFRQMGSDPAHHTVWGTPAEFLARVVAVVSVEM